MLSSSQLSPSARKVLNTTSVNGWNISNIFDDAILDRGNFGLDENPASALLAVITALSMLLLLDLVFRFVVRAHRGVISSHAVYRLALLSRISNPLRWFPSYDCCGRRHGPTRQLPSTYNEETISAFQVSSNKPQSISHWKKAAIIFSGIFLALAEMLLLFFTTNQDLPYHLNLRQFPSLEARDTGSAPIRFGSTDFDSIFPVTTKSGFTSHANVLIYSKTYVGAENRTVDSLLPSPLEHPVSVALQWLGKKTNASRPAACAFSWLAPELHLIRVREKISLVQEITLAVALENGEEYRIPPRISIDDVMKAVPQVLHRNGLPLIQTYSSRSSSVPKSNWTAVFVVDVGGFDIPTSFLLSFNKTTLGQTNKFNLTEAAEIFMVAHLLRVCRSALSLTSHSRGFLAGSPSGPFLDETDAVLVTKNRPRLSISVAMIICGCLGASWAFVVCGVGWQGSVDDRRGWGYLFCGTVGVEHMEALPEKLIEIN